MDSKVKKIGVLTSGGDAPGMNAAIRAVTRAARFKGIEVDGVRRGYAGLINGDIIDLSVRDVSNILQCGGTMLFTARSKEFCTEEGMQKAVRVCREHGIEGLVVIGGDGSYRGAGDLSVRGIPCIGLPGTIDNDISSTDFTIGFDTCINCVIDMVDRIRDTMRSHERCSVVEVMGRNAGYIALHAGIATGAAYIMVPEIKSSVVDVIKKIEEGRAVGKTNFIVIVAEGVGHAEELSKYIQDTTGVVTRATVLGHVQRGGSPTARDRVLASQLGCYAVDLLAAGQSNRVVGISNDKLVDYDIQEALAMKKEFPMDLYHVCNTISI
ncbi:MAG: 6-phosphofructokinase [Clostridiales bacterium]|nr:MAG: 6-phosphofructokinase [Clostridiales bacterium]